MESPDYHQFIYEACNEMINSISSRPVTYQAFDTVVFCCASPVSQNGVMVLSLALYEIDHDHSTLVLDLGMHNILNCDEQSMQKKLFPLLSYMFLGLYLFSTGSSYYSMEKFSSEVKSSLDRVAIVESMKYKKVFNYLFSSMCSVFSQIRGRGEDVRNEIIANELVKAQQETLLSVGPAGTYRFMHVLASYFTYDTVSIPAFKISYGSSVGGFWRIASYSLLDSLEMTKVPMDKFRWKSGQHLVNCIIQFGHDVNIHPDWIEVCMQIDNVTCDVLPPLDFHDLSERQFPAKICLTVGPEHGFGVQPVSLSVSTDKFKNNWGYEQSIVNGTDAKIDWTLYDSTTGKTFYSTHELPESSSSLGERYFKACRAFTEQAFVVFTKNDYGKPIKWGLDKDLEGKTLKWVVRASIWFDCLMDHGVKREEAAAAPYSRVRRHDFHHVVDLKLEQNSIPI